jgi:phosphoenolpyruvate carboxylase
MTSEQDQLATNVRALGAALGRVLSDQSGAAAFALEERVRRMAFDLRSSSSPETIRRLTGLIAGLSIPELTGLIQAFTLYFGLVNLAEHVERLRILRSRNIRSALNHAPKASPQPSICCRATVCRPATSRPGSTRP